MADDFSTLAGAISAFARAHHSAEIGDSLICSPSPTLPGTQPVVALVLRGHGVVHFLAHFAETAEGCPWAQAIVAAVEQHARRLGIPDDAGHH